MKCILFSTYLGNYFLVLLSWDIEVKYIWWSEKCEERIPENILSIEWFVKMLLKSESHVVLIWVGNVIKGIKEADKAHYRNNESDYSIEVLIDQYYYIFT